MGVDLFTNLSEKDEVKKILTNCNNLLNPDIWPKRKRKREGGGGMKKNIVLHVPHLRHFLM